MGRHQRPEGFSGDLEKYGAAQLLGWDIYRCDGKLIYSGQAIQIVESLYLMKTENSNA